MKSISSNEEHRLKGGLVQNYRSKILIQKDK